MDSPQKILKYNTWLILVRIVLVFVLEVNLHLSICLIAHCAYVCAISV